MAEPRRHPRGDRGAALARATSRGYASWSARPDAGDIDPVRFLGNPVLRARWDFAIAERAALRGADVTLVAGP